MNKIAILRLGALGDIYWAIPYIRNISSYMKYHHPKTSITLITKTLYVPLAKRMPFINEVIENSRLSGISNFIYQARVLKQASFHTIFDLQMVERTMLYLITLRLMGWKGKWYGHIPYLGKGIPYKHSRMQTTQRYKILLASAKIPIDQNLFIKKDSETWQKSWKWMMDTPSFSLPKKYIVFVPGSTMNITIKQWPMEYYAQLASTIYSHHNIPIVIVGDALQTPLAERIFHYINPQETSIIDLTGKTTLFELAYIIFHSIMTIGGDTGPMHLAQLLQIPAILLFAKSGDSIYQGDNAQFIFSPNAQGIMKPSLDHVSPLYVYQSMQPYIKNV